MKGLIIFNMILIFCTSCTQKKVLFVQLNSANTHIKFQNKLTSTVDLNILNYLYYYNGAGIASADFNNDGLVDLYFVGNQIADKLYLNKGELIFEDITTQSFIKNDTPWTTGVSIVDINNDGYLDIYICKIGKHNTIVGKNLLFVNQGPNKTGIPTFIEKAGHYGLDIRAFSTQASFFDYDKDGDLDLFLLNHSLHPNSSYGKGANRNKVDAVSGDKFFENVAGKFKEVSATTNIFQGKIGYGLGLSIGDVNNDGYPDIYVGNDFFENDYLYINQKDKTFKEIISADKTKLGHTSHFSMGNAMADLNNDTYTDIISLDMLPENLQTYKTSGREYPYQNYEYYLKNGYAPQFMQNTLHYNNGNETFSETAYVSGVAATEWSWSPIVGDFDNDGFKDLYITNGILGATNDMDYINFISNKAIQKQLASEKSERNLKLSQEIPQKKVKNYFYKNNRDNTFTNVTEQWASNGSSFSNGGVSVDLDNDGDLDLVVNNINEEAYLLKNTSIEKEQIENKQRNYLKIKFKGSAANIFGIGTKIKAFLKEQVITEENYTTKGYLSAVAPGVHIGLGTLTCIDSLHVIWPNNQFQILKGIAANQEITLSIAKAKGNYYQQFVEKKTNILEKKEVELEFKHRDTQSLEFNRDPLIPYASTNLGPDIAVADINADGLEDVFISGAKGQASKIFIQNKEGVFKEVQDSIFKKQAIHEDVAAVFFDANSDAFIDLLVVSGGNEFRRGKPLQPRLYVNNKGVFDKAVYPFKNIEINASKVKALDIDNDGDMDITITSNLIPWQFGKTPKQYIFLNDGFGNFTDVSSKYGVSFQNIGNVQDIIWVDLNNDRFLDAIAVGYWMPVSIFINDGKKLTLQKNSLLENTNGWWNAIKAADFDKDGDIDLIVGNWGLNTRLKASLEKPITLFSNDFDDNNTLDPIITYYDQGLETPFASKDELAKQLPFLNKKYLSYTAFANATFKALLPEEKIKKASKKYTFELASCYFENLGNNTYKQKVLPFLAQVSSVNDMALHDFNKDGFTDVLLVGNNYNISTQLGKLDASHGVLLLNDQSGFFKESQHQNFDIPGEARTITKIKIKEDWFYMIAINNDRPIFLKITN
jgi:hypothetical protein